MFAGTEDMFEATIGLVRAIFQTQGIDPKLREMIILRAATVLDAPYEWQANTQMAKNAGLSSKEIDAAGKRRPGGRHQSRICSGVQGDRRSAPRPKPARYLAMQDC
jgi:alkylhydroperoxidase family enzyme